MNTYQYTQGDYKIWVSYALLIYPMSKALSQPTLHLTNDQLWYSNWNSLVFYMAISPQNKSMQSIF